MNYLRQSTASQEVLLGPFLDDTDGKTAETALTIANTDIKVWVTGATSEASKNSGGATHIAAGRYYCVLDATDTATIGPLELNVAVSGALPVKLKCCVLAANVYDVLFGTTAPSTYAGADTSGTTTLLSRIGGAITISGGKVAATVATSDGADAATLVARLTSQRATNLDNLDAAITVLTGRLTSTRAGYLDTIPTLATAAQITALTVNTRANLNTPVEIETPDSSTLTYKVRLHLYDVEGNMEAPDSTPTVTLVNAAGTDRSSRLSSPSNPSTGVYTWDYTATAGDAEEQLIWVFTVVEGSATRTYPATSYVVEESAYRFSSSDRTKLTAVYDKLPANDIADSVDLATASSYASTAAFAAANAETYSVNTLAIVNSGTNGNAAIKTVVNAIKTKTDGLPADPAGLAGLASAHGAGSWATATGFAVAGDAMALTAGERNTVADVVLRRKSATAEDSASGESPSSDSLYGLIRRAEHSDTTTNPGSLTVFRDDGAELVQLTLATDPASEPVTGVS